MGERERERERVCVLRMDPLAIGAGRVRGPKVRIQFIENSSFCFCSFPLKRMSVVEHEHRKLEF